jgi:hypothetical protein
MHPATKQGATSHGKQHSKKRSAPQEQAPIFNVRPTMTDLGHGAINGGATFSKPPLDFFPKLAP